MLVKVWFYNAPSRDGDGRQPAAGLDAIQGIVYVPLLCVLLIDIALDIGAFGLQPAAIEAKR